MVSLSNFSDHKHNIFDAHQNINVLKGKTSKIFYFGVVVLNNLGDLGMLICPVTLSLKKYSYMNSQMLIAGQIYL